MKAGKEYPWPRPACCPHCDGKLWGHGYTARYFEGSSKPLWLKRYRCVNCHAVHTLRPKTHWRRFQAGVSSIFKSLRSKIVDNCWIPDFSRQRQEYWYQGFKIQLELNKSSTISITFNRLKSLLSSNIIAATHSLRWFRMVLQGRLTCVPSV